MNLDAVLVLLNRADPAGLADEMHRMLGGRPDTFNQEPAILDFSALDASEGIDWNGLASLLRRYRLQPVGVCGLTDEALLAGARRIGLAVLGNVPTATGKRPQAQVTAAPASAETSGSATASGSSANTLYIDRVVRSGQQIYAQGGDLVLLAGVSPGSEVIADGNIHCFGPLAGRALAGARGDANARIIATCFGPELVAVAGIYRTFERGIHESIAGRAVVVRMKSSAKNQSIIIEPLQIN
ncbi:MAG: septum site-determining protein MinC [Proteobacteria bacterium]|jgi:septum site-determining protein MinC|nr:septum site-determining protein MinC [Pseudomonadota bacterium]